MSVISPKLVSICANLRIDDYATVNRHTRTRRARREQWRGRTWLVAPLTMIVPGVLNGSKGALYYPPSEVAKSAARWEGIPITNGHPFSTYGQPISAQSDEFDRSGVLGMVRNPHIVDRKLRAEGWFDLAALDFQLRQAIEEGQPIEVSTGLFTENSPAVPGERYNDREFRWIARNYVPDHLAILDGEIGACAIRDGCGLNVINAYDPSQKRDDSGRWTDGGSSGSSGSSGSVYGGGGSSGSSDGAGGYSSQGGGGGSSFIGSVKERAGKLGNWLYGEMAKYLKAAPEVSAKVAKRAAKAIGTAIAEGANRYGDIGSVGTFATMFSALALAGTGTLPAAAFAAGAMEGRKVFAGLLSLVSSDPSDKAAARDIYQGKQPKTLGGRFGFTGNGAGAPDVEANDIEPNDDDTGVEIPPGLDRHILQSLARFCDEVGIDRPGINLAFVHRILNTVTEFLTMEVDDDGVTNCQCANCDCDNDDDYIERDDADDALPTPPSSYLMQMALDDETRVQRDLDRNRRSDTISDAEWVRQENMRRLGLVATANGEDVLDVPDSSGEIVRQNRADHARMRERITANRRHKRSLIANRQPRHLQVDDEPSAFDHVIDRYATVIDIDEVFRSSPTMNRFGQSPLPIGEGFPIGPTALFQAMEFEGRSLYAEPPISHRGDNDYLEVPDASAEILAWNMAERQRERSQRANVAPQVDPDMPVIL